MMRRPCGSSGGGKGSRHSGGSPRPTHALSGSSAAPASSADVLIAEFTARWERGEWPPLEDYLARFAEGDRDGPVECVYREFCLAEGAGLDPRPEHYLLRFPDLAPGLRRVFEVHEAFGPSGLGLWSGPPALPEVGDEVGPYRLVQDLGRGGFSRVYLAEQADLDDRLVVVKVATRITPEPQLLARASHPHIVEVLWHGVIDGGALQLICMPFLGGATLAAVRRTRCRRGGLPRSGLDLLDDLDRASPAGYPASGAGRPARGVLARLSYPKAVAWVVARLAEGLDYAFARGVLHGDVKPSNVLVTSDGTPMLLDFNLAVGWRPGLNRDIQGDPGGTLAYMAPERLLAVAEPGGRQDRRPSMADRHRADIYSLGVVLLELLGGHTPDPAAGRTLSLQQQASAYVAARSLGGAVMIRAARTSLPAGLKAVLRRCLAADPADRYARASELADDLDRWREDFPLAHARVSALDFGLARWARRGRRPLAAVGLGTLFAAVTAGVVWWTAAAAGREQASRYARSVYNDDSSVFRIRRPGRGSLKAKGEPAAAARRHLDHYHVLDAEDWRRHDEFRRLPPAERDEIELWLLEQALRFAKALSDRPTSPEDWRRARYCLDRIETHSRFAAIQDQRRVLSERLGQPDPPATPGSPGEASRWMDQYLLGVRSELLGDSAAAAALYRDVLKDRPASFWAHYRAAVVAFARADEANSGSQGGGDLSPDATPADAHPTGSRAAIASRAFALEQFATAAGHLLACVTQRPDNPVLRRQYAGCLYGQERYLESAEQCNRAMELDPDHAETYLSRSLIRLKLGQVQGLLNDLGQYEVLTGGLDRRSAIPPGLSLTGRDQPADLSDRVRPAESGDPDEFFVRREVAAQLSVSLYHDLALEEYDRVLARDPGDIRARYGRAVQARLLHRDDSDRDFSLVVADPEAEAFVRKFPSTIYAFNRRVSELIQTGSATEAVQVAMKGVDLSTRNRVSLTQAQAHYNLARALALASKTDQTLAEGALASLSRAYRLAPEPVERWYLRDSTFSDLRAELGPYPFGRPGGADANP